MKTLTAHMLAKKGGRRARSPFFRAESVVLPTDLVSPVRSGVTGVKPVTPVLLVSFDAARGATTLSRIPLLVTVLFALLTLAISSHLCAPRAAWADTGSTDTVGTFTTSDGRQAVEDSALLDGVDFGLNGFTRNAKGTARAADGVPEGYRFPLPKSSQLVVISTPEGVLVHVDSDAADVAGFDLQDTDDQEPLRTMLEGLDESHSMGGSLLRDVSLPWTFTSEDEVTQGVYTYRFSVKGEDGDRYTTVTLAGAPEGQTGAAAKEAGVDLGDGVLWCDNAELVAVADVVTTAPPTALDRAAEFFGGIDYRPFWVSLKTSGIALAVTFVLGLFAAWKTMGTTSRVKGLLDSVFTIPMVLPPTVCGFLLLMVFGQSTAVGRWLIDHGIALVFTWPAAVISAAVVSFPLMYRTALGAFEALDAQMLDAARTLGWSELRIFRRLMLPLAWPSIAAGTVLAFARAMGEFGATLFFAGNYAGITQTIPIAIYFEWMGGNTPVALFWVVVVIVFSFLVILFINIYTAHSQKYRSRGLTRAERQQVAAAGADGGSHDSLGSGGDALRIDREALRALMLGDARDSVASEDASDGQGGAC